MANNYVDYRLQTSPSWWLSEQAQTLSYALGTEEDVTVQAANSGVLEKMPDYAGLDSPGVSTALAQIGYQINLFPIYGDKPNLDDTRLYYKSGMSFLAAGATLPWFPLTDYTQFTRVGAGGYVWQCTTPGTSGQNYPFPTNALSSQQLGQTIVDGDVVWTLLTAASGQPLLISSVQSPTTLAGPNYQVLGPPPSPLPNGNLPAPTYQTVPNAPGWYWAGTENALIDALVNAGFYTVDPSGNIVLPRVYTNADWINTTATNSGIQFTGALSLNPPADISITSEITGAGVAGAGGTVSISLTGGTPLWLGLTLYAPGSFVHSANGDVFYTNTGGTSGAVSPFPVSTPGTSVWPPTTAQGYADGSIVWTYSSFSPIPTNVNIGGSWGLSYTGSFISGHTWTNTITNSQPDGNSNAWARIWLALPADNLSPGGPYLWGNGAGGYDGNWGQAPGGGGGTPVYWGTREVTTDDPSLYGIIRSICQRWVPAHVQVIGAWLVNGTSMAINSIPASHWVESFSVEFGAESQTPPFFRFTSTG